VAYFDRVSPASAANREDSRFQRLRCWTVPAEQLTTVASGFESTADRAIIRWQWCRLEELNAMQLHALFAAREAVFVVEQACAYQELDAWDLAAEHLIAWQGEQVAAYLRLLAPGVRFAEPSVGRVLTAKPQRRTGLGRELLRRGLHRVDTRYSQRDLRISAQLYLERFYRSFGFVPASEPYPEDGIAHIEMLRRAPL
jgi:ElaA protein